MTQQLLLSPAPRPRPFRVCNWDRSLRKGIMAPSLAELLCQVSRLPVRLSVRPFGGCLSLTRPPPKQAQSALLAPGPVVLVLEEDGTAVETEAFFRTLEEGAVLMALAKGQSWAAPKVSPLPPGSIIRNPPQLSQLRPRNGIRRDAAPRGCLGYLGGGGGDPLGTPGPAVPVDPRLPAEPFPQAPPADRRGLRHF